MGSARAGPFDGSGAPLGTGKHLLECHRAEGDIVEQSGDHVWQVVCVCGAVQEAVAQASIGSEQVAGIGFDATCSLVVRGPGNASLPRDDPAHPEHDIIVWMDHRALDQAASTGRTGLIEQLRQTA